MALLRRVVRGEWPARFAQVELVAGMDLALALSRAAGGVSALLNAGAVSRRAARVASAAQRFRLLPLDLRATVRWHLDDCDVEVCVRESVTGKRIGGLVHSSPSGALMSRSFTCGFGPVEFLVKQAPPSCQYELFIKLHQRTAKTLCKHVIVLVELFTHW